MLTRDGRWQMSDWRNERSDVQFYVEQAQEARAEAMARVGYLAVATVGRAVGAVDGGLCSRGVPSGVLRRPHH